MKCPKCGYLGFEEVDRCRNCGYDFSLVAAPLPDLSLRGELDERSPLDDLALVDAAASSFSRAPAGPPPAELDRARSSSSSAELPLFWTTPPNSPPDDTPLITKSSPPRPPLAVRRATPDVPRLRSTTRLRTPMLDLNAFDAEPDAAPPVLRKVADGRYRTDSRIESPTESSSTGPDQPQPAGVLSRAGAVVADVAILAVIDLGVIYLTMKVCGLRLDEFGILPKAPLAAFLAVENLAYFVGFTIGGQTPGKMATGIKVVPAGDGVALDFGRAVVRTLVWVALAVPAGLGFVTALFGDEHRGLHDRCAGTKVVRAST